MASLLPHCGSNFLNFLNFWGTGNVGKIARDPRETRRARGGYSGGPRAAHQLGLLDSEIGGGFLLVGWVAVAAQNLAGEVRFGGDHSQHRHRGRDAY